MVKIIERRLCLSKFDRNMIYFAKSLALTSRVTGKHASIIVYKNKIKAIGINYHNPLGHIGPRASIHAECAAINKLDPEYLEKCILYVSRSTSSCNGHSFSRPCEDCLKEIISKRIKTVIYSCGKENEWLNNNYGKLIRFVYN